MLNEQALVPWGYRPPDGQNLMTMRGYWWAQVMARLKPGVDAQQALGVADALFQRFTPDALPQADRSKLPHIGCEPGGGGLGTLAPPMRSRCSC